MAVSIETHSPSSISYSVFTQPVRSKDTPNGYIQLPQKSTALENLRVEAFQAIAVAKKTEPSILTAVQQIQQDIRNAGGLRKVLGGVIFGKHFPEY